MFNTVLHHHDANGDPLPSFPTDAEIEFAEQLRHQLEERYLAPAEAPPLFRPASSKGH